MMFNYVQVLIEKYFDSIRHDILLHLLKRKIKDRQLILLCEKIIRLGGTGMGLPIGNLTSQFLANVYLNDLDYFIKQELKAKHYIRYMDDFVLFSHDRIELKAWKKKIKAYLTKALALRLKDKATFINHAENGLTFLGRRIFPNTVRMARPNLRRICTRMARRENDFKFQRIDETTFLQSMNSYWAILEPFPGLRSQLLMDNQQ